MLSSLIPVSTILPTEASSAALSSLEDGHYARIRYPLGKVFYNMSYNHGALTDPDAEVESYYSILERDLTVSDFVFSLSKLPNF